MGWERAGGGQALGLPVLRRKIMARSRKRIREGDVCRKCKKPYKRRQREGGAAIGEKGVAIEEYTMECECE